MELPFECVINWTDRDLWICIASIIFNPVSWNIVARLEYKGRYLTRLFGSAYTGCYVLAVVILLIGFHRDWRYQVALEKQMEWDALDNNIALYGGYAAVAFGTILVLTSFWALGITGTFLGDYFYIFMDERVTGFPFNVLNNPMYVGSTLNFLGIALIQRSQAGLFLSGLVYVMYRIVSVFEESFTTMVYTRYAASRKMV